jgi:hypothetical protein
VQPLAGGPGGRRWSPGAPRQAPACRAEPRSTWARNRWSGKSPGAPGRGDRGRDRSLPEHLAEADRGRGMCWLPDLSWVEEVDGDGGAGLGLGERVLGGWRSWAGGGARLGWRCWPRASR